MAVISHSGAMFWFPGGRIVTKIYIKNGNNGVKTIDKFDTDYAEQEP